MDTLFNRLLALQQDKKPPPIHLWKPEHAGEIDIRIDRDGHWYHEGGRFERKALVELFASILRKEQESYFLVTPAEKLSIQVEDVPFLAVDLDIRHTGTLAELLFTTNVGDYVLADRQHPIEIRGERPYLMVRDDLYARLTRNVYYRLVDAGIEEDGALYVYSQGTRFWLGAID